MFYWIYEYGKYNLIFEFNIRRLPLKKIQRLKMLDSINRVQTSLLNKNWPPLPVSLYDFHIADE